MRLIPTQVPYQSCENRGNRSIINIIRISLLMIGFLSPKFTILSVKLKENALSYGKKIIIKGKYLPAEFSLTPSNESIYSWDFLKEQFFIKSQEHKSINRIFLFEKFISFEKSNKNLKVFVGFHKILFNIRKPRYRNLKIWS